MAMIFALITNEKIARECAKHRSMVCLTLKETLDKIAEAEQQNLEDDKANHFVFTTQVLAFNSNLLRGGWRVYIERADDEGNVLRPLPVEYGMSLLDGTTLTKETDIRDALLCGLFGDGLV